MNILKNLIVLATRMLGQACAKAKKGWQSLDVGLYQRLFSTENKERARKYKRRHWALIRSWGFIAIGVLWLMPLLILNVSYGITTTGCSSPRGREWLGSFCAIPHLNMATQRQPWYLDLWDAQDSITHDVRLPAPDRNLVIGYHHICDAELYFSQQLAKTALLPDDLETTDLHQGLKRTLAMSSTLCPQLQNFSDIFCIEKDIQNHAFRSLVEAYTVIIMRSDRMQLSFWHHWFAPINPVMRMLNRECRIPWIYEPRLFDFQIHAELHFQLQHFLTESKHSMDRVEAEINRVKSRPLDHLLEEATNTFKDLRQRTKQEGGRRGPYPFAFLRHILPASYFHSPGGIKGPKEYHDLSTRILQRLEDLRTSLTAYHISIVHMKRQHSRLQVIMASESGFDLALNGVVSIPRSEISNLANASFIDLQNPSLTKPEDGSTRDTLRYDYNLDTVLSPSDVAALRRVVLQVCLEKSNVYIVSGFLHKICILWRHATSRSEFDGDLLGPVQRSWSFEQARVEIEHRKSMGYDDDSISQKFAKYYREYREGEEGPAFV